MRLDPAAGVDNRAAADLKHEVQALPLPIPGRAFQCQRAARHQIIDQQARRTTAHRHGQPMQLQHMAVLIEPQLNARVHTQGRRIRQRNGLVCPPQQPPQQALAADQNCRLDWAVNVVGKLGTVMSPGSTSTGMMALNAEAGRLTVTVSTPPL